jgi:hypothetical protein
MIFLFLSFIAPVLVGVLLTFIFFPSKTNQLTYWLFKLCFGIGLGIGITSCVYFISLVLHPSGYIFMMIETALMFVLIIVTCLLSKTGYFKRKQGFFSEAFTTFKFRQLIPITFYGALVASIISMVMASLKEPHGKWDAWLIWNLHARFIHRGGDYWRDFFSSGLDWSHLDYPLLIPLSIARGWKYIGGESLVVPLFFSILFTLMTIGLICSSLSILRSKSQGYLSGLVLMGSPFFVVLGASQTADVPLSFFLLATLVAFVFYDRFYDHYDPVLIMAGIAAGLSAWTKNEGLLFLIVVMMTRFLTVTYDKGWKASAKQTMWFIMGLLPVLMIVIYFKTNLAPATDLFSGQTSQEMISKLFDFQRYYQVLITYLLLGISFTQGVIDIRTGIRFDPGVANIILLSVYVILVGMRIDRKDKLNILNGWMILLFILAGYFFIYVISPHDLKWHLPTSLNRLLIQLWPSTVFLCFMMARTPEDAFMTNDMSRHKALSAKVFATAGEDGPKKKEKKDRKKKER